MPLARGDVACCLWTKTPQPPTTRGYTRIKHDSFRVIAPRMAQEA
jgi:hypothetical protein